MCRRMIVVLMCLPYVGLCIYDLASGKPRTGIASGLLAIVTLLIYWR